MEAATYLDLIETFVVSEDRATFLAGLMQEADGLVEAGRSGQLRPISPWPFPGGPSGPLVGPDGVVLHGAYARTLPDGPDIELVVCNAGWLIERQRCPGPIPPATPMCDPINYWLAQQPFLAITDDRLFDLDPDGVAIARVAAGLKPLGLAAARDEAHAGRLGAIGRRAGLAVVSERSQCDCGSCDGEPVWFIEAARREPFVELVDLDAIAGWYASALPRVGAADHVDAFASAVLGLAARCPSDYLGRSDPLIMAPYNEEPEHHTSAVGVVLGYWPPTSAALHLRCRGGSSFVDRYEPAELRHWGGLRHWVRDDTMRFADRPVLGG